MIEWPAPETRESEDFREPDVLFVTREHDSLIGEQFWLGADLVMEVVLLPGFEVDVTAALAPR